ncbi:hypothetical protein ACJX0J_006327, partial [Zea mays]
VLLNFYNKNLHSIRLCFSGKNILLYPIWRDNIENNESDYRNSLIAWDKNITLFHKHDIPWALRVKNPSIKCLMGENASILHLANFDLQHISIMHFGQL